MSDGKGEYAAVVSDIYKKYGRVEAVRGVSLSVAEGERLCVIGRNGCGKSTLLGLIAGTLRPDSGEVRIKSGLKIGFAPQEDVLFADLSVLDNLKFWNAAAKGGTPAAKSKNETVAALGLEPLLKKRVKALSGGMRRRVSIAAAQIRDPEILILDEPFSGLDAFYKRELSEFLTGLAKRGKTIIYTSHSPDEISGTADSVVLIEGGRVASRAAAGDAAKLFGGIYKNKRNT
ncbi:MAG: ABC transporter ATP-binding protein [Clostridiales bacterium]|nr:ABC transporter ATP-binding protein [Clostridiales bacterium]